MSSSPFTFVTCQVGAESVCKQRILSINDSVRFAFSRPGCLTFKLGEKPQQVLTALAIDPFVRTFGYSVKTIKGEDGDELAKEVWQLIADVPVQQIHCWSRDEVPTGHRGYEPQVTALAQSIGELVARQQPQPVPAEGESEASSEVTETTPLHVNGIARSGEWVLDVIVVQPNEWLVGFHQADAIVTRWPGGIPPFDLSEHAVSRAYLKIAEALEWSRIPFHSEETVVEIGSAPGGSCQFLLEQGMQVIGIDPADMDEEIAEHPNFVHWKMRGADVKRRSFQNIPWLTVDVNIAPQPMLQMVAEIVSHERVNIQGMILTLKLNDWEQARHIDSWMRQVRSWGFKFVKVRQLVYNRMEVCLVALRHKSLLRVHRPKS